MPRRYRRHYTHRRNSALPLVVLLVAAVLLLIVVQNGSAWNIPLPRMNLPALPDITIPITGLPQVQIPSIQIPLTIEPGTLSPQIGILGTPLPNNPSPSLGKRSKTKGCVSQGSLPDPSCTPGAVMNTNAAQVCQVGYAQSVRDVSDQEKEQVYAAYGIASHAPGQYEVDHLIPLELGGSNDLANLWPEPAAPAPGFQEKNAVEDYLRDQVCSGKMTLVEAQRQIASNWVAIYDNMPR